MLSLKKGGLVMGYSASTVAGHIVSYAHNHGIPITNLQLQKILYFLQLRFYGEKNAPLFDDDIEKWKLGPVVPNVYHDYKIFGSNPITLVLKESNPFGEKISSEHEEIINEIIDKLLKEDGFNLVERTHKHSAWKKDEARIKTGEKGIKYTKEELINSYKEDGDI
jgi:uncharacterized phage-associated protein